MSFHRSLAFLLLGLVSASGQEAPIPPVVPPVVPAPPAVPASRRRPPVLPEFRFPARVPAAPAGAPAAAQPAPAYHLGDTKIIDDINEPKLSGNALAGLYRKYTGRRVIVSAAAATAEFSLRPGSQPAGSAHLRRSRRTPQKSRHHRELRVRPGRPRTRTSTSSPSPPAASARPAAVSTFTTKTTHAAQQATPSFPT